MIIKFPDSDNQELHGAALFALGEIWNDKLDKPGHAKWAFEQIKTRFPDSSWTEKADQCLLSLGGIKPAVPAAVTGAMAIGLPAGAFTGLLPGTPAPQLAGMDSGPDKQGKTSGSPGRMVPSASQLAGIGLALPGGGALHGTGGQGKAGLNSTVGHIQGIGFQGHGNETGLYSNRIYGFNLPIPSSGWYYTEDCLTLDNDCEVIIFKDFSGSANDPAPNINVLVKSFHTDVSALSAALIAKKEIQALQDSEIEEEKAVTKEGSIYFYRRFRYWHDNIEYIAMQGYTCRENLVYIITATYSEADSMHVFSDIEKMVKSFKVN
jgi:hypothetical protein